MPYSGAGPDGITTGPDGNLYFVMASKVGRITPSGDITLSPSRDGASFVEIAGTPDGTMWVTELEMNAIWAFRVP